MITPPHLVRDGGEWRLDVSAGTARVRLRLTDRVENLLVEELEYDHQDIVPLDFVKTVVLTGGANLPNKNPRALAWQLTGAEGGRELTTKAREALADYLEFVTVPASAHETLQEHVRACGLADHLGNGLRTRADKVSELSDIARDL